MKELTIEQKAEAYDEAIKRAEATLKVAQNQKEVHSCIVTIFPELRESEDERIRKAIINYIKTGTYHKSWLAWLEKQGETYTKKDVDEAYIEGMAFAKDELEKQNKQILANSAKTYKDEHKSTDKIEPKFHEDEWLCENEPNNYARFIQILETVNVQGKERYRISRDIHNDEDIVEIDFVEKYYHKFDIKDAKDGDVLCTYECEEPKIVFILKGTPKKHYALSYYCYYNIMYPHFDDGNKPGCLAPEDSDIKPATKEQRDTLFAKMKEAGYEWDADKLELRKISQRMVSAEAKEALYDKPKWDISDFRTWQYIVSDVLTKKDGIGQYIDSGECKKIAKYMQEEWSKKLSIEQTPKKLIKGEDYGIDGLYHAQRILEKTLGEVDGYQTDDGILEHQCAITAVKKLYEQKPTWSEEDKNKPNGGIVMEDFNDGNGFYKVNLAYLNKEQVEEIEELVERWDLQPKVSEDKSIISDLLDYFNEDKCLKHEVNDIVKWLKTINPQQKGWSENEINMLDNLITYLGGRKDLLEEIKRTYIDWLKSLKPQKQWKPSEEQIKALHDLNLTGNISYAGQGQVLIELYNDLKKLTE